jgi:hypothetical protein
MLALPLTRPVRRRTGRCRHATGRGGPCTPRRAALRTGAVRAPVLLRCPSTVEVVAVGQPWPARSRRRRRPTTHGSNAAATARAVQIAASTIRTPRPGDEPTEDSTTTRAGRPHGEDGQENAAERLALRASASASPAVFSATGRKIISSAVSWTASRALSSSKFCCFCSPRELFTSPNRSRIRHAAPAGCAPRRPQPASRLPRVPWSNFPRCRSPHRAEGRFTAEYPTGSGRKAKRRGRPACPLVARAGGDRLGPPPPRRRRAPRGERLASYAHGQHRMRSWATPPRLEHLASARTFTTAPQEARHDYRLPAPEQPAVAAPRGQGHPCRGCCTPTRRFWRRPMTRRPAPPNWVTTAPTTSWCPR